MDHGKKRYLTAACLLIAISVSVGGSVFFRVKGKPYLETKAVNRNSGENNGNTAPSGNEDEKEYIKWVEFHVTKEALQLAYEYDLQTHGTKHPVHWIELLAYLGAKYGGDFSRFEPADMNEVAEKLFRGETTIERLTRDMDYYAYYYEAYEAILGGMVGEYQVPESTGEDGTEDGTELAAESIIISEAAEPAVKWETRYGLKAFHPIAKGFPYSDYDDFGVSRTYGYKRNHLGHDMMGQVGTPVVAVESGYVAELGWNQYGGWRVGINSFDGKRYYYYAHLRQNVPFAAGLEKGSVVQAGDVIGYIGRTGYSKTENVNNIDEYHLHFGLQLIFDEAQREGNNQIWIDVYPLVRFLYQNQSETVRNDATKEWSRAVPMMDPAAQEYEKNR